MSGEKREFSLHLPVLRRQCIARNIELYLNYYVTHDRIECLFVEKLRHLRNDECNRLRGHLPGEFRLSIVVVGCLFVYRLFCAVFSAIWILPIFKIELFSVGIYCERCC